MKRREALKNLGIGVTAGLVLPTWLTSCSKDEIGPEIRYNGVVGIIGAGAAGMAVADYLIAKGVKVKIFEASGRVGGRVESLRPSSPLFNLLAADFHVELGADRIFGTDSEFGNIVKLLKVPTTKFRGVPTSAADYYMINNQYLPPAEANLRSDFLALKAFKESGLPGYSGGGSVQSAAGASADMQGVLNSWLGNAYGSTADRIGANALGEALSLIEHDKEEFMLIANPISDVLSSRYNKALKHVQLNSPVKLVNYSSEDSVELTLESGAKEIVTKLVVTSPITVLKDTSKLGFTPSLPASKINALSRMDMDPSMRIVIEFTRNGFFQVPNGEGDNPGPLPAFIYGGQVCPSYFFSGAGRSELNRTVSLTVNGPKALEFSNTLGTMAEDGSYDSDNVQLVLDEILDEMDVVFDGKASLNIRKRYPAEGGTIITAIKDWTKVPYIGGGQSYPLVSGTNEDRVELAAPIEGKVFFAGEATDFTGEFGTISGALKSGKRAAEEVVAAIVAETEVS